MFHRKRVKKVKLNGSSPSREMIHSVVSAVQSGDILSEKGGYIFKATLSGETLRINIMPAIIEMERSMHHKIVIKGEEPIYLSGSFNADSSLMLFPLTPGKPSMKLSPDQHAHAKTLLARFCTCMLAWGISPALPLDQPTQQILSGLHLTEEGAETLQSLVS